MRPKLGFWTNQCRRPSAPPPKFGQSVEISLISFCILGPFHVVKHTTWLFQEFPIPLISTIFSWESTAQFALSVVILTDATRNHWITGHRGRGSPPPRHQALRPPPPPLPGTFSATTTILLLLLPRCYRSITLLLHKDAMHRVPNLDQIPGTPRRAVWLLMAVFSWGRRTLKDF